MNRGIARGAIAASVVIFALVLLYLVFFYTPTTLIKTTTGSDLYSANWSGYAAVTSSSSTVAADFDSVSASWTVPEVASAQTTSGYSSAWIGIGGLLEKSNRLIQVGTEQDIRSDGSKDYYAWLEVLPRPTVNVGHVSPGDLINARINRVDNTQSTWHITLSRESKGIITTLIDNDVVIRTNSASTRSAEFIVEAPAVISGRAEGELLPLANFGTVAFANCTTNLGGLGSLANLNRLVMTSDGTKDGAVLASPSAISDGKDGFSVSRLVS